MSDRVLVTGASGFIAKHVIAQALGQGWRVRGTVRSMARRGEVEAAVQRARADGDVGRLDLVEADLNTDEGWQAACDDCRFVLHVASPFPAAEPRYPEDLIRPAREGVRRVIGAAATAGVERIVVTSSIIAIMHAPKAQHLARTEADWSDPDCDEISSYGRSKTLAERAAWREIATLNEAGVGHVPELAVVNPGVVFGPALDNDLSTSHLILKLMGRGSYPALPKVAFPVVDVRDVAAVHLTAMRHEKAAGERFLCCAETLSLKEVGEALVAALPDLKRKVPTLELPSALVRMASHFDRKLKSIRGDLDKPNLCDTTKVRTMLGASFRPAREAVGAGGLSLRALGVI